MAAAFPISKEWHGVATAIVEGRWRRCNPVTVRAHGTKATISHQQRWGRENEETWARGLTGETSVRRWVAGVTTSLPRHERHRLDGVEDTVKVVEGCG